MSGWNPGDQGVLVDSNGLDPGAFIRDMITIHQNHESPSICFSIVWQTLFFRGNRRQPSARTQIYEREIDYRAQA